MRSPSSPMNDQDAKDRAVRILVGSLYRELTAQGFDDKQVLAVAIELLGKVTDRLAKDPTTARRRA
jgi:hypothetical protein